MVLQTLQLYFVSIPCPFSLDFALSPMRQVMEDGAVVYTVIQLITKQASGKGDKSWYDICYIKGMHVQDYKPSTATTV